MKEILTMNMVLTVLALNSSVVDNSFDFHKISTLKISY